MREIWFKARRISDGEWVEGFCVMYSTSIEHPYSHTNGDHYIITVPHNYKYQVDPETVCQYTGLTDKNGKKIFEGDIVRYGDEIHKVVFEQRNRTAYFGLAISNIETMSFGHYVDIVQVKVIGNIFDNPDFLENRREEKTS